MLNEHYCTPDGDEDQRPKHPTPDQFITTPEKKCDCDGFEDCWSYGGGGMSEGHYTRTIHNEDCPDHPTNRGRDDADDWRDRMKDKRFGQEVPK